VYHSTSDRFQRLTTLQEAIEDSVAVRNDPLRGSIGAALPFSRRYDLNDAPEDLLPAGQHLTVEDRAVFPLELLSERDCRDQWLTGTYATVELQVLGDDPCAGTGQTTLE